MSYQGLNGGGAITEHYKKIYALQDIVLEKIFSLNHSFYLTGGTALSRYYYHVRYSDDLDFFCNNNSTFKEEYYQISQILLDGKLDFKETVSSKDFIRLIISRDSVNLQVDFVNDYIYRNGLSKLEGNVKIDNIENIFANKIRAIIDRDEAKDICDLVTIVKNNNYNWDEIFNIVSKKQYFMKEDFIQRLQSFPLDWLAKLKYVNRDSELSIKEWIMMIIEKIKY